MDGFALTYYKLLVGEYHTSGLYGDSFLYQDAVNLFIKEISIYREIIDIFGEECEMHIIDDYFMMLHAIYTYYFRMGYAEIEA
jgi:hypothetical protein